MSTDGYPDQFGGSSGKKLKIKNVKQLLLSTAHLPADEQKSVLNTHFENWKGKDVYKRQDKRRGKLSEGKVAKTTTTKKAEA